MKRMIWAILIIVIILIGAYFVNNFLENKTKEDAEKTKEKAAEKDTKVSVSEMVARTNAIDTWEKALFKGESFRVAPVLTVELERLWLTDRPILFIGTIKDIATIDKENYRIEIGGSLFNVGLFSIATDLRLALQCPRQKVDLFLGAHPNLFKEFENGVAVVADIDEINTKLVSGREGEEEKIKIGNGRCIDMLLYCSPFGQARS